MKRIKKIIQVFLDIMEIYIPAVMLFILFASFLIGIIWRYVFRVPQSWTYELSTVSFLYVAILSICVAHRLDSHVVFDMFYNKFSMRRKCLFRMLGNLLITVFAALLIPVSVQFVIGLQGYSMQIIRWMPRMVLFLPFPIMFFLSSLHALIYFVRDFWALIHGAFPQEKTKT